LPGRERSTDSDTAESWDSPCTFRQVIELLNLFNACTMEANMLPVALLLIFIAVRLRQVNFSTQPFLFAGIVRVTYGFPGSQKISGLPAALLYRFFECAGPFLWHRLNEWAGPSFMSFSLESIPFSPKISPSFVGVSHRDYTNAIVVPQFNALAALERGFNDVPTKFKCSVSADSQKGF